MIAFYIVFSLLVLFLFLFFVSSAVLCLSSKWCDGEYHHTERKGYHNIVFYQIGEETVKGFYPAEGKTVGSRIYGEGKKYRLLYNEKRNVIMDKTMIITNIAGLIFTALLLVILVVTVVL